MFEPGKLIRIALVSRGKTQVWLIDQLRAQGIITDKTELSSVLSGTRGGPKAETILATAKAILALQ